MREFEGKNVVIVGASTGLGEALVNQFSNEGSQVFALSRNVASKDFAPSVDKIACDITKVDQVESAFDDIEQRANAINLVITTVGLGLVKAFSEITDDEIEQLTSTNLLGPLYVAREAYKRMLPHKQGHIVTVSSTTGLEGKPQEVLYSTVKQGIRGMNQALSKEASEHGIEATCVFPGGMRSENFWNNAKPGNDISGYMPPEDVGLKIVEMLRQDSAHPVEFVIRRPAA